MFGNIWIMNQSKQGAPPFLRGSNSVGVLIQLDILQLRECTKNIPRGVQIFFGGVGVSPFSSKLGGVDELHS